MEPVLKVVRTILLLLTWDVMEELLTMLMMGIRTFTWCLIKKNGMDLKLGCGLLARKNK